MLKEAPAYPSLFFHSFSLKPTSTKSSVITKGCFITKASQRLPELFDAPGDSILMTILLILKGESFDCG